MRDLHRGHEREERDKKRAKEEVARLNRLISPGTTSEGAVVSGGGPGNGFSAPWRRAAAAPTGTLRQATPADREQQLAQLAEMGVAVPEDFRKEMAMAGEWQTLSETPLDEVTGERMKKKEGDVKPEGLNVGVRKRRFLEDQAEEDAEVRRNVWGSTTKLYSGPSGGEQEEEDLNVLLGKTMMAMSAGAEKKFQNQPPYDHHPPAAALEEPPSIIKKEHSDSDETNPNFHHLESAHANPSAKLEGGSPPFMFKKRKAKAK